MAVSALEASVEELTVVVDVTDDIRQKIAALRGEGRTLAEIKSQFPALSGEQVRSALPPANARERKQREAKAEVTKGIGGHSGKTESKAKPKEANKAEPKSTEPKYIDDAELSQRVLAARQVVGRAKLAELLGISQSATWRAERDRVTPDEVEPLRAALAQVEERIAKGEFVKPERQPAAKALTRAALEGRIDAAITGLREAAADKRVTKAAAIATALERLDPPQPTETQ